MLSHYAYAGARAQHDTPDLAVFEWWICGHSGSTGARLRLLRLRRHVAAAQALPARAVFVRLSTPGTRALGERPG